MKIYHIVNPYQVTLGSEDDIVQQKTLESIRVARDYVKGFITVDTIAKVDEKELDYFKSSFSESDILVAPLERLSNDLDTQFNVSRRLPLLNDLITVPKFMADNISDEDYIIFTNMDICLQPYFYAEVGRLITRGYSCFVINRKTIDKELLNRPLTEAYIADGDLHIGHDCFVLPAKLLKKFHIKEHILGIGFVFRPFLLNCILHSDNFHEFENVYMTFHYGDDMTWKNEKYADYLEHNKQMMIDVFTENIPFIEALPSDKRIWIEKFFPFDFLPQVTFRNV